MIHTSVQVVIKKDGHTTIAINPFMIVIYFLREPTKTEKRLKHLIHCIQKVYNDHKGIYDDSHKSLYDRYILFECSQSGVLSVSLFLLAPVGATCNRLIDLFLIPHKVRLS